MSGNIYAAQASDGDNWVDDFLAVKSCWSIRYCRFANNITPTSRLRAVHTKHFGTSTRSCEASFDANFAMKNIKTVDDIFPVFRELFQKETA